MRTKKILSFLVLVLFAFLSFGQHLKKDGTPDMRYKENKQTYSAPASTVSANTDVQLQNGYTKKNYTVVKPYHKTKANKTNKDNYSTKGKTNPYTGKKGTRAKDYSKEAKNYGKGKTIRTGSKGGQYYINSKGSKTYVPKRY
jgi:hypothetical protein